MSTKRLATRPATQGDFQYVWSVYSEAVKPYIAPKLKDGWHDAIEMERFRKAWKIGDSHIITLDDSAIGWGAAAVSEHEAHIYHLYIEPAHRGKKYGTRLVSEMTQKWTEEGKAVHAPVLQGERLTGALSRLGFVKGEHEPAHSLTQTFTFSQK